MMSIVSVKKPYGALILHQSGLNSSELNNASPQYYANIAREIRELRLRRLQFFPEIIFSEPAWDILLDLYQATMEGRATSVKSACMAAQVPFTTALRWLTVLEKYKLVVRSQDVRDKRRSWLYLTPQGAKAMSLYISQYLKG